MPSPCHRPTALAALVAASVLPAPLAAVENVDARSAYAMVTSGAADLVDTRTLEEAVWVGSPADADGRPLATLIPWETMSVAADGSVSSAPNPRFAELVARSFPDKERPLILMCRSGGRSAAAAKLLEGLGYAKVFNLDAPHAPGAGAGGFQGSSAKGGEHPRYRGYPGRLPADQATSWLDAGLPVTQQLDPAKIPR